MAPIVPKALRPGSHVRVIAPSSPFDRALVLRGLGWLAERYRVTFARGLFSRRGFLAGTDERRCDELTQALEDPTVEAIVAARGGHGTMRFVERVPWERLRECPKWLVGFSDITVLHVEAWQRGVASLHAAMVGGLGRGDQATRQQWLSALEQPEISRALVGAGAVTGRVEGPLVGGNLTLLTMLAAAGRLRFPPGCILALEDVGESSYSVDRMLATLRLGGYFDQVAGFAVGEFFDCGQGQFNVPVVDVLLEQLGRGSKPVVLGLPFGHGRNISPLTFGAKAQLNGAAGTLATAVPCSLNGP